MRSRTDRWLCEQEPAVDAALAKLLRVLPAPLRERAAALHDAVAFTPPPRDPPPVPTETVLALARAVRRRRRVNVRHRSASGAETERDVDPYGVVGHGGRWYLSGHDHLRDELRAFRVDRLLAVEEGAAAALAPPPGFDAVEHVVRTLAEGGWRHAVEVVLHTAPEHAASLVGPTTGALAAHPGGGTLLRVRAEDLGGMARMLAGLGPAFTIITPPALRDEVAALARRLLDDAARAPLP